MRPVGRRLPTTLRQAGIAALLLLASGCAAEPVTREAKKVETLYNAVLVIAIIIFVGVVGTVLWCVVRYRHIPGDDELPPQTHGNTAAEIVWTALPTIIVLVLFGMSYTTLRDMEKRSANPAAIIQVRGFQWAWEFDYGDGKVVKAPKPGGIPEMVVPVGADIRVIETSDNVIHSFFVPEFLFKLDVVPGQQNEFEFRVDIPGTYKGQCAELCGDGHADMNFAVRAVGRAEFDKWYSELSSATCTGTETPDATLDIAADPTAQAFDKDCLVAPANQPVTIQFNNPSGQPHNVAIAEDAGLTNLIVGPPVAAIVTRASDTIEVPAKPPGEYFFFCQVHPVMKGTYQTK